MTWYWKLVLVAALAALVTDILFRSPATVSLARSTKAVIALLAMILLGVVSWNPILEQYRLDSTASHPDPGVHPLSAFIAWAKQINERWLDRITGALVALIAVGFVFMLVALIRWLTGLISSRKPLLKKDS